MVGKLLKHELHALFRTLVFFAAAVIVLALAGRILIAVLTMQSEENASAILLLSLVITFYVFSIFALIIAAYACGVNRFYRTLFTGEGYMTLSLPATPEQLITAKLLSALIGVIFATVVSSLSAVIFLVGWDTYFMEQIYSTLRTIYEIYSEYLTIDGLFIFEIVARLIVSLPMALLVMFAVISLGQLFTSNRKLLTFVFMIAAYFIWNSLTTMLQIPFAYISEYVSPHLSNWLEIIIYLGIDVGSFFLVRYILKNQVNLIA